MGSKLLQDWDYSSLRRGCCQAEFSRAGWVPCTACWGNGHICGCRCSHSGGSRGQPSCRTRRSASGRWSCRLDEIGKSGTKVGGAGFPLSDMVGMAPGCSWVHVLSLILSPILMGACTQGGCSRMGESRAERGRPCEGQKLALIVPPCSPRPTLMALGPLLPGFHLPPPRDFWATPSSYDGALRSGETTGGSVNSRWP